MREKDDVIEAMGTIVEAHRGGYFVVHVDPPLSRDVICRPRGKMVKSNIFLVAGDRVEVEISAFDTSRGRVTFRGQRRDRQGAA